MNKEELISDLLQELEKWYKVNNKIFTEEKREHLQELFNNKSIKELIDIGASIWL